MNSSNWLVRSPLATRKQRLYCFSYGGGSAYAYSSWQAKLAPDTDTEICAIELPGHGSRMAEEPYQSLPNLIASLGQVFANEDATPFMFFGHSLGGLVAFELARFFARNAMSMPLRLIVSGTDAPQYRRQPRYLHKMPDDELIEALGGYNGTPPEVLQNRELMELVLPTIRADFSMSENYEYRAGPLLNIPITVYQGTLDDHIMPQKISNWRKETSNQCSVHWFEGDHFFINSERTLLLECLKAELSQPRHTYPIRSREITLRTINELNVASNINLQENPEILQPAV